MSKIEYCLNKILHKVFSFMKINKFLQGLVGFGNLRLRRSKVVPQLSKLLSSARRFGHWKKVKSWIFLICTQTPWEGPLTILVHWKVVWNHSLWCLAWPGVDFGSYVKTFFWQFSFAMYMYGRIWDFGCRHLEGFYPGDELDMELRNFEN